MPSRNTDTVFCTYFDRNYLPQGLALIASLRRFIPQVKIYILCFDTYSESIIRKLKLKQVSLVKRLDFEDKDLQKAKNNRSFYEYYWTCSPALPYYLFRKYHQIKKLVYVDADIYFFNSPQKYLDQLDQYSLIISEHRYPKHQIRRCFTSGRFNAGLDFFKRNQESLACLKRWRRQCLTWCHDRLENEKFGNQLYLNEWPDQYPNLHVSPDLGLNAAPWNISQYQISQRKSKIFINRNPLICYHFHQFKAYQSKPYDFAPAYPLSNKAIKFIYQPYVKEIEKQVKNIKSIDPQYQLNLKKNNLSRELKFILVRYFGDFFWRLSHYVFPSPNLQN